MSRILIHSNAPWVPSGYGKQAGHLGRVLTSGGNEVIFSAFSGLGGAPIIWQNHPVLPNGMYEFGIDTLIPHIQSTEADLTIALMDVWKLAPIAEELKNHNMAAWLPVDCTPLSKLDEQFLNRSGVKPIAMSLFGRDQIKDAGFKPLYAPHVVDRITFAPRTDEERSKLREEQGVADRFVIGMCAANNDTIRKGFPEQFAAFKQFHDRHPEAMLWLHTVPHTARGLSLGRLMMDMGIDSSAVRVTDSYPQVTGQFTEDLMADWYSCLDVLSNASYAEAFGVPLIEAQACGTPVVTTDGSAMQENSGAGWAVGGDRFWNHVHGAWWVRPNVREIRNAYEDAYMNAAGQREAAAHFAAGFDVADAGVDYWDDLVAELCD